MTEIREIGDDEEGTIGKLDSEFSVDADINTPLLPLEGSCVKKGKYRPSQLIQLGTRTFTNARGGKQGCVVTSSSLL